MKIKYLESKKACLLLFTMCFVMYTFVFMTKNMFSAAMASVVEQGIMTKSQTGAISAVFWFVYAPFQIIGGFAADRFSPSKLICIGMGGAALSNLVIYFTDSYPIIMAAWIFNAAIQFGVWPSIFKIVSTQVLPSLRSTFVFLILFSSSVGQGLSLLVASFVSDWKHNFIISFISLIGLALVWIFVSSALEKRMVEREIEVVSEDGKTPAKSMDMVTFLFTSGLVVIAVVSFLRGMIDNAIKMVSPTMLMETYADLPAALATRLGILLVVFSVIGIFVGRIPQKKENMNEMKVSAVLLAISLPMMVLSFFFLGNAHYLVVLICLAVAMIFIHGANPFSLAFISARYTDYGRNGTVSGILNAASALGYMVASYAFAKIAEVFPWTVVILIWTVSVAVTIGLCLCVLPAWSRFIGKRKI